MNKEETKKKIAELLFETNTNIINKIIGAVEERRTFLTEDNRYYYIMADALIAAGIGDVREVEHRAEVAERALEKFIKNNRPCEDCQARRNGECKMSDEERKECAMSTLAFYKQLAEKELAEEKNEKET